MDAPPPSVARRAGGCHASCSAKGGGGERDRSPSKELSAKQQKKALRLEKQRAAALRMQQALDKASIMAAVRPAAPRTDDSGADDPPAEPGAANQADKQQQSANTEHEHEHEHENALREDIADIEGEIAAEEKTLEELKVKADAGDEEAKARVAKAETSLASLEEELLTMEGQLEVEIVDKAGAGKGDAAGTAGIMTAKSGTKSPLLSGSSAAAQRERAAQRKREEDVAADEEAAAHAATNMAAQHDGGQGDAPPKPARPASGGCCGSKQSGADGDPPTEPAAGAGPPDTQVGFVSRSVNEVDEVDEANEADEADEVDEVDGREVRTHAQSPRPRPRCFLARQ